MKSHIFAIYVNSLDQLDHKDLHHRLIKVLRLELGREFVLFDSSFHISAKINFIKNSKKLNLTLDLNNKIKNKILSPNITVCLTLLKKDALEAALYNCVELGANKIQLISSSKSEKIKKNYNLKRFNKILIAAAEQSKNFAINKLDPEILSLEDYLSDLKNIKTNKICFDVNGQKINNLNLNKKQDLILLAGPEGGFTDLEIKNIKLNNFEFCKLTPTVLRAYQAISLGLGMFRSFI